METEKGKPVAKGKILVADDQASIRRLLKRVLEEDGYFIQEAKDGQEAVSLINKTKFHLIISDLKMPRLGGMELLEQVKQSSPETLVVLLTAYGTVESAVQAIKLGAFDYLSKPLSDPDEVRVIAKKAMDFRRLSDENAALKSSPSDDFIHQDPKMTALVQMALQIAKSETTTMITGESGTGKEVIARLIHNNSGRANRPFVAINCAAMPDTLLESELFGHERGAFTGADRQRRGRFEVADGGTLFLDEVGEMSAKAQAKLLRILQERSFERVGGTATITVDVRIITATNRDLRKEIKIGRFREDLFYRLNVLPISIIPLRERSDDIVLLANHFILQTSKRYGKSVPVLSESAQNALLKYGWPGNVRELMNVVERLILLHTEEIIEHGDLGLYSTRNSAPPEVPLNLKALEKDAIVRALKADGGNRKKAAEKLGIGLRTLHYKLNEYELRDYLGE